MPAGSLWTILHHTSVSVNPTQKTCIAIGIAHGMRYLHRCNIVHLDLKSPNILLDHLALPKIADFGLSRFMEDGTITSGVRTPQWMAPEQIRGTSGPAVDVYAFGVILYEMLTGRIPFCERKETGAALCMVIADGVRPHLDSSGDLEDLIVRCWDHEPSMRPTFEEIYALLASSIVQFPGTELRSVRTFTRMKIENEIEPRNPVAEMTTGVNEAHATIDKVRGGKLSVADCLCHYAEVGSVKDIARFIRAVERPDLNATDRNGRTPLICAAYFGQNLAVQFLAKIQGVDINKADGEGVTPLMAAVIHGHVETVRLLLSIEGTDVNKRDSRGFTVLHLVLFKAPIDALVRLLIDAGIDRNITDVHGVRFPLTSPLSTTSTKMTQLHCSQASWRRGE
jgi:hypothetical protein